MQFNKRYSKYVKMDRPDVFFNLLHRDKFVDKNNLSEEVRLIIFEMLKESHIRLSAQEVLDILEHKDQIIEEESIDLEALENIVF